MTLAKRAKRKTKDQKAQSERFVEKAKELGADESAEAFERAFKKIVRDKMPAKHVKPDH